MEDLGSKRREKPTSSSSSSYATFHELSDKDGSSEETFTLSEAVEKIGLGKFQILLILMAGFINMCDSLELMLLSVLAPTIQCLWHLSSWEEALITTVVFVGMALGSILWGWIADNFGRKVAVVISSGWVFYFGLLSSFSPNYIWIIALRSLVGVGIGGIPIMFSLLIEFLPIHIRSYVLLGLAFFWAIGSAFLVGTSIIVMPTLGWRWLLGISTIPVAIFIILCKWMPESPRFSLAAGEKEAALKVLHRMAEVNGKECPQGSLQLEKNPEDVKQGRFRDLFSDDYRMTTLLLWLIFLAAGTLYFGVVLMTTELFKESAQGNTGCSKDALVSSSRQCGSCKLLTVQDYTDLLWTTFAEFPGLFLTMLGIERIGRKKTLAAEFFLIAASLALLFICTGRTLMLVFIFLVRGLSMGAFQGFFVYAPEVYPTIIRTLGFGACCMMARIGAMLTPYIAQVLLKVSVNLSLGVYISLSLLAAITTLLLPYETKGRAIQDT